MPTDPHPAGAYSIGQIAFWARLADGRTGIFRADPIFNKNICPESQGFWKGHGGLWPVASLVLGGRTYTEDQLLMLLSTSSGGNAALILTDELIATKLNLDVGSNPAPISSALATADSELAAVPALPTVVRTNTTAGQAMEATAATSTPTTSTS